MRNIKGTQSFVHRTLRNHPAAASETGGDRRPRGPARPLHGNERRPPRVGCQPASPGCEDQHAQRSCACKGSLNGLAYPVETLRLVDAAAADPFLRVDGADGPTAAPAAAPAGGAPGGASGVGRRAGDKGDVLSPPVRDCGAGGGARAVAECVGLDSSGDDVDGPE